VTCSECTRACDIAGITAAGRLLWHNLWDLTWVKESPIWCLATVADALSTQERNSEKWDHKAVRAAVSLVVLAHPELAKGPLSD
jgi:hypothetical protein